MTNRVTISADGDSTSSNNTSSAIVKFETPIPDVVDMGIDKNPKIQTIENIAKQVLWTLTYSNNGNTGANNVVIVDTLPAGFTYVDGSASPAPTVA